MRLPRPHIPIEVRVKVARRQVEQQETPFPKARAELLDTLAAMVTSQGLVLKTLLLMLFSDKFKLAELHHRPALMNREKIIRRGKVIGYRPNANDPDFLVYVLDADHDVETRVRGQGAQLSDQAMQRKLKRIAEKRDTPGIRAIVGPRKKRRPQHGKMRSANRWPPKGSRKLRSRKR